jgi:hypothetical protein
MQPLEAGIAGGTFTALEIIFVQKELLHTLRIVLT